MRAWAGRAGDLLHVTERGGPLRSGLAAFPLLLPTLLPLLALLLCAPFAAFLRALLLQPYGQGPGDHEGAAAAVAGGGAPGGGSRG
jgi:hypothetical protein